MSRARAHKNGQQSKGNPHPANSTNSPTTVSANRTWKQSQPHQQQVQQIQRASLNVPLNIQIARKGKAKAPPIESDSDDEDGTSDEDGDNPKKKLTMRTKRPSYTKMMNLTRHHWIRYFSLESLIDDGDPKSNEVIDTILVASYGLCVDSKRNTTFKSLASERMRKWTRDWQRATIRDLKVHVDQQLRTFLKLYAARDNQDDFINIICERVNIPTLRHVFKPCAYYVDWNACFRDPDLRTFWVTIYGYFCYLAYENLVSNGYESGTTAVTDSGDTDDVPPSADELSIFKKFRLTARAPAFRHIRKEHIPFVVESGARAGKTRLTAEKKSIQDNFLGQIRLIDNTNIMPYSSSQPLSSSQAGGGMVVHHHSDAGKSEQLQIQYEKESACGHGQDCIGGCLYSDDGPNTGRAKDPCPGGTIGAGTGMENESVGDKNPDSDDGGAGGSSGAE